MRKMVTLSNQFIQRYLPDPYIIVLILTLFVFLLGLIWTPSTPIDMINYWGEGFWSLLSFTMQMVLVLITGYVLANSPFFLRVLQSMASLAKSPGQAIIYVTLVSLISSWINWGFGIVIGALFSKELAKAVRNVDYRLLIASAYSGFIIWHGGLSGSIPLTIATEGHFSENSIGIISTSETIFSLYNLVIIGLFFIVLPLLNRLMLPSEESRITINPDLLKNTSSSEMAVTQQAISPAEKLQHSKILSYLIGILGICFLGYYFVNNGFTLNLDIVNFLFLFLGILFHQTPKQFLMAVEDAVKGSSSIIIQFPFYAGIMGMMVSSGLAVQFSEAFVSISNSFTFPLLTFLSAGFVNLFIPSGGGQWAVQAPIMIEAAKTMDVSLAKTAMAVAWGDAWTNLIQPFWALPALAIAGLKAKDIMGFCFITLIISGIIISCGLLFL